ncbi:hypothetical protein WR25_01448 [Diploscapter pachys]|uniref:Splicing factor YJU2 n=1 Tax=Diploscapter pachys TaxID=2018661 RepID=A0A2A2KJ99_9BILA|nr:hypothetical protein WR25_01448 [Diploscapter pachys]
MTGTERKVFQKYYPPDFDPSKIPRAKGKRNRQFVQRVMTPFNMQCNTCKEYIYKGKKFNMRRETVEGETYLGLKLFRFYFRCPNCLAEITFKTDLQNCDYQNEHGATRLFEAVKLYQEAEKQKEDKEEEEKKDPMKMLEKRTKMSKAEMEALGELEDLQEVNRAKETFDVDGFIEEANIPIHERLARQEMEDEKEVMRLLHISRTEDGRIIKRVKEEEEEDEDEKSGTSSKGRQRDWDRDIKTEPPDEGESQKQDVKPPTSSAKEPPPKRQIDQKSLLSKMIIVKKKKTEEDEQDGNKEKKETPAAAEAKPSAKTNSTATAQSVSNGLLGLGAYGSDSDSE